MDVPGLQPDKSPDWKGQSRGPARTERLWRRLYLAFGFIAMLLSLPGSMPRAAGASAMPPDSAAFYYGVNAPVRELSHFDWAVVQPDNFGSPAELEQAGTSVFAYVSVGEIEERQLADAAVDRRWFIADNKAWKSLIADLTAVGWQDYLVERRMAPLWAAGYRGFFLDTLDSYLGAARDEAARNTQAAGLVSLVQRMHRRFPGVKLLFNRGFEVLPKVADLCTGVAAESLFAGWDQGRREYRPVPENDRAWLLARLREVHETYRLPVIAIDYMAPARRDEARAVARQIRELGFIPWVADPALDALGVSSVEVVPRRILALYDGGKAAPGIAASQAHRLLAPVLEYLGYAVDYADANAALPAYALAGRYAGLVSWFEADRLENPAVYGAWLERQIQAGLRIAAFGRPGLDGTGDLLERLGIKAADGPVTGAPRIRRKDAGLMGFEAEARPRKRGLKNWRAEGAGVVSHLALEGADGQTIDAVLTAPWGGVALEPYVVARGPDHSLRWILNPFKFLSQALALPELPIPDLTTENGRRLLLVTLHNLGAMEPAEMPGTPLAVEVIRDRILRPFPIPATLYLGAECGGPDAGTAGPGDLRQRLAGLESLKVVDTSCATAPAAPPNTRSEAKGLPDFQPPYPVEGIATGIRFSHTQSLPTGLPDAAGFRVYPPLPYDDLAYTDQWRGPLDGYRRVLDAFKATDAPLRTKPLHIRYHLLSGTRDASVEALREVYRWVQAQEALPVTAESYAARVADFQSVTLSRDLDGEWRIRGLGTLGTLRLPVGLGSPDPRRSEGLKAVSDLPQGRYADVSPGAAGVLLRFRADTGKFAERDEPRGKSIP